MTKRCAENDSAKTFIGQKGFSLCVKELIRQTHKPELFYIELLGLIYLHSITMF